MVYGSDDTSNRSNLDNRCLQVVGTYTGHDDIVACMVEVDDNTLITGSMDRSLRVWNKTSCACLNTIPLNSMVDSLLKTKDNSFLLCGKWDGSIEVRQLGSLQLVTTIQLYSAIIPFICELEDGTFIAGKESFKRWTITDETVLQTFTGHSDAVQKAIELKSNVVVTASLDTTLRIWDVLSGICLHVLSQHVDCVSGLVKLKKGYFASGSMDATVRVWDEKGNNIVTYETECWTAAMTSLEDGSLVLGNIGVLEIRKL